MSEILLGLILLVVTVTWIENSTWVRRVRRKLRRAIKRRKNHAT